MQITIWSTWGSWKFTSHSSHYSMMPSSYSPSSSYHWLFTYAFFVLLTTFTFTFPHCTLNFSKILSFLHGNLYSHRFYDKSILFTSLNSVHLYIEISKLKFYSVAVLSSSVTVFNEIALSYTCKEGRNQMYLAHHHNFSSVPRKSTANSTNNHLMNKQTYCVPYHVSSSY